MPKTTYFEQQFFDALRNIFVGATIEGESGFINLMRIKSRYYTQGVFPHLKKDIDAALTAFPEFREELFDKLYSFFQRYFSESGSIYFRYTPLHQKIYEKVYTDDRDVVLFWKTHMLYYVKTDRIFRSLGAEVDGFKFWFDASQIEHKRANEKRNLVFSYKEARSDGTLVFTITYSERGRKTKEEEILRELKKVGYALTDEILTKAFRVFEKQSEVDFFINKDARSFLREQFDLWLYQYLFEGQNVWSAERLSQLQTLKNIAYKVIDFISQFEDELVKVWNKPKFVRNSHYVITLDKLQGTDVLEKILAHPNFLQQLKEWQELGFVESDFQLGWLTRKDLAGDLLHSEFAYLPFDTRYFPDLELDILSLFDDLDTAINGWLIHSENYQALNSIKLKFNNLIKSIYIDPPYNTGSDGFLYNDKFNQSNWLTMIENRLYVSKSFLNPLGIIFVSIDENEIINLSKLLLSIFPEKLNTIIIRNNPKGRALDRYLSTSHEYLLGYAINQLTIMGLEKSDDQLKGYSHFDENGNYRLLELRNTHQQFNKRTRPNLWFPIYVDDRDGSIYIENKMNRVSILPVWENGLEGCWTWSKEKISKEINLLLARKVNNKWKIFRKDYSEKNGRRALYTPKTIWDESEFRTDVGQKTLDDLFGSRIFMSPKPSALVERSSELSPAGSDIILDFFAGSGTTAHAVMNLNREDGGSRKYILVEMGEHFNTVILPRIKKVAFNSKWKDGKPVFAKGESGMSHFIKYYDLEQYEEVLQKARYNDSDLFDDPNQDPYHAYVFLRDLKMLDSLEIDQENDKVHFHPERLYPGIDLAETLSHLRGKWIKRITKEYVEFQDGEQMSLIDPDWETLKPMIWWQ